MDKIIELCNVLNEQKLVQDSDRLEDEIFTIFKDHTIIEYGQKNIVEIDNITTHVLGSLTVTLDIGRIFVYGVLQRGYDHDEGYPLIIDFALEFYPVKLIENATTNR